MKKSTQMIGGLDQIVCLDRSGVHWISLPPKAAIPLVGNLATATVTALVSMISPVISGGSITGATLTLTLNGITVTIDNTLDSLLGEYAGILVADTVHPNQRLGVSSSSVFGVNENNFQSFVLGASLVGAVFTLFDASGNAKFNVNTSGLADAHGGFAIGGTPGFTGTIPSTATAIHVSGGMITGWT
jgi:hypothetical protein